MLKYNFLHVSFTGLCRNTTTALSFVCRALKTNNIINAPLETSHMMLKMDMTSLWPEPFTLSSQNLGSFQLPQPLSSTDALSEHCAGTHCSSASALAFHHHVVGKSFACLCWGIEGDKSVEVFSTLHQGCGAM